MNTKTETSSSRPKAGASHGLAFGRVQTMFLTIAFAMLGMTVTVLADRVSHDVAAGYVRVDCGKLSEGSFPSNDNTELSVPVFVNGFSIINNHNISDHKIKIGETESDDIAGGVAIFSVAETMRNNQGSNMTHTVSANTAVASRTAYEAATQGVPLVNNANIDSPEDNVNFSAAWFPYSGGWIGGHAWSEANNGVLSNWNGSPLIAIGTHFINGITNSSVSDAERNGIYYLDLRSYGIDSRRDGVLLVNHAKNEANYALSRVNNDDNEMDGTWTIYCHDNRVNGRSYENDPVTFVFVPKSNTNLISGMFMGEGAIAIHSGATPQFDLKWHPEWSNGVYELKIPGYSPQSGVLIVSGAGGDPNNGDNIVTYQPNAAGDGWLINSRDLPPANLQNVGENEAVCSFVFIPAQPPGITINPTENLLTTESGGTAAFTVTLDGFPKPTADVTVNLSVSDATEASLSDTTLTFTPADWGIPKTVTLTGLDDAIVDGTQQYQVNLSNTSSTDLQYDGLTTGTVYALNNDTEASVVLDKTRVATTEAGGAATFNLWLTVAPSDNVTIALSSDDLSEATVSPSSLTFTPADYSTPQTVTVTGVDDLIQDGPVAYFIITAAASSTDPNYNGQDPLNVLGENVDDDLAKVNLTAFSQTVSEPNGTITFPVVLNSEPTANVTVNFSSTDTTEGTVTPSVTFTPGNWNTPQDVTITAVDDFLNDGDVQYSIVTSISSADLVYAALSPSEVLAQTLDNEARLTLPSGTLTYGIGDTATGIDGYATVADATADYDTGSLTASVASAAASDHLDIRNDGTGAGQIGVSGSSVTYEGVTIGTKSGGTGATALTVNLNASATPAAAQALVRAITYQNVDSGIAPQTKTVTLALADGDGGVSTVSKQIIIRMLRVYSYQQATDGGFGVFTGANDCQIVWDQPNTLFPEGSGSYLGVVNKVLWIDWNETDFLGTDQSQALLRFTNIFGTGPGQIPPGAKIVSAELIMNVTDSGHGAYFNRMLLDWDAEGTTFASIANGDGIQRDGVEATTGTNAFLMDPPNNTTSGTGLRQIGVTADIQAWLDGAANYGWVISPKTNGANGTAFSPSEFADVNLRPRLKIAWLPGSVSVASFQQGVDGYAGAVDTQVREVAPDTTYDTATTLSPDWVVTGSLPNPNQVLIKFGDIIGTGAGQVPPGSTIHAAVLDLVSINADAQGAGGQWHALLREWMATDTWNTLVNGISADGIEAALSPTITLPVEGFTGGSPVQPTQYAMELTSDVQAWANGTMANNGWAIMPWPGGSNGWAFNSTDNGVVETRPQLRVYFEPGVLLLAPVHKGSSVEVSFSGVEGKNYTVQRTTSLAGGWANVGNATVTGGVATYIDNAPPAGGAFYRVTW